MELRSPPESMTRRNYTLVLSAPKLPTAEDMLRIWFWIGMVSCRRRTRGRHDCFCDGRPLNFLVSCKPIQGPHPEHTQGTCRLWGLVPEGSAGYQTIKRIERTSTLIMRGESLRQLKNREKEVEPQVQHFVQFLRGYKMKIRRTAVNAFIRCALRRRHEAPVANTEPCCQPSCRRVYVIDL